MPVRAVQCECPGLSEPDVHLCYSCRMPKRQTVSIGLGDGGHLHLCGDCGIAIVPTPPHVISRALARGHEPPMEAYAPVSGYVANQVGKEFHARDWQPPDAEPS